MEIRIFLPSNTLVTIARRTIVALAYLASGAAVLVALALVGYVLTWFCSVLILFVHAFSDVCQATFTAVSGNLTAVAITFVIWSMFIVSIKLISILFPFSLSFNKGGAL